MTTPADAEASMIANLEAKTGKSLAQWISLVRGSGRSKHGEIVTWLKAAHEMTHGYANLVAHKALRSDAGSVAADGDDLVGAQYAGAKAALRPICERILAEVRKLGADVEVSPKKTYVSLRRTKQFALVQPSTATRVDVGIQLKGVPPTGRLEASGSFNAMVTHRVRVERPEDVDAQLIGWLRKAYEGA